jgi:hypothetical protein
VATFQVTGHTPDTNDLDRGIRKLCGLGPRRRWNYTTDEIIQMIGQGHYFYVLIKGHPVSIIVRQHPLSKRHYLTTEGSRYPPKHLLSLPPCAKPRTLEAFPRVAHS